MLVKDIKRLALILGPLVLLTYLAIGFYISPGGLLGSVDSWNGLRSTHECQDSSDCLEKPDIEGLNHGIPQEPALEPPQEAGQLPAGIPVSDAPDTHQPVFSTSSLDRRFFSIQFGDLNALNPNIIPHPKLDDTWIIVAQWIPKEKTQFYTEILCNAVFLEGVLRCTEPPIPLIIASTVGKICEGDAAYFNLNIGPHDARVFNGPTKPYVTYGSNSKFTCFGQWIQDLRVLTNWRGDMDNVDDFRIGTEMQRPLPWGHVEKNWFVFWDSMGQMYVHHDVVPKRVFTLLNEDGSTGPDLAPLTEGDDQMCLAKYLPHLALETDESIHQSTNSLLVTMCLRSDPTCVADESNTFVFTIIQHKKFYNFHSVYEPYVMMFRQQAPFEMYAMSSRPLWIHGRQQRPEQGTSDMFYVTSMSWKQKDRRYHGYLDDEIFLAFGIEDERTGGVDVLAGDLLGGLQPCVLT